MARIRLQSVLVFLLPLAVGIAVTSMLFPFGIEVRAVERSEASAWPSDETALDSADVELFFSAPPRVLPIDAETVLERLDAEKLHLERAEEPDRKQVTPIPEPAPGLLITCALVALAMQRRPRARARG